MERSPTEVLIVGAGPTGLTLAVQLGRYGVPCRIIDSAPAPTDKSKAIAIHARTMELFATIGIAQAAIADGIQARGFDFFANGKSLGAARFTADLDTPYPSILLLPQSETERLLIGRMADFGIHVERAVTLTHVTQDADGVRVTLGHPDGQEEEARYGWVVGCDGAHSTIRHALSLPFEGAEYAHDYWLADLHVHWSLAHDTIHAFLSKNGFLFAFPIPEANRYRLIVQWGEATGTGAVNPTLADLQRAMDVIGPAGATLSDPVWLTAFHLHHRKVARYQEGRVFVAGDAAHIHSPAGGQGMNTGIQDADNLAWKLALTARGAAKPALLASYDAERNAVGAQVLRQTDLMFRLIGVQSPFLRALRNLLMPLLISRRMAVRQMQQMLSGLGIRYRSSPIVAEEGRAGGPHAGMRAPDAPLATATGAETRLWSLLREARPLQHTLLLLSGPQPSADDFARLAAIRQMIAENFPDTVAVRLIVAGPKPPLDASWEGMRASDPNLAVHRRYGAKCTALVLIRPDGYIGFRSQTADGGALEAFLRRIFREAA
ncbi:MAG: FAD-dependent monooxygenase [Thermomicrobia bacterium]|nr:FAD-dependent monooxygenase [Thermomicrobia bacterium]